MWNDLRKPVVWTIVSGAILLMIVGCESKPGKDGTEQRGPRLEGVQPGGGETSSKQGRPLTQPLETIQGIVYLSGNEPFVNLALETLDGTVYYLTGEKEEELRRLQNRMVRVTGYLHPSPLANSGRDTVEVVGFEVVHSEGD
jgi:hypothetical protein